MKYFGKHLNKDRDFAVKYGWMISKQKDEDLYLFKFIKRTPYKELYYEKITDQDNIQQVKKNIKINILKKLPDEVFDINQNVLYSTIEETFMDEEFYRYRSLTDILKNL